MTVFCSAITSTCGCQMQHGYSKWSDLRGTTFCRLKCLRFVTPFTTCLRENEDLPNWKWYFDGYGDSTFRAPCRGLHYSHVISGPGPRSWTAKCQPFGTGALGNCQRRATGFTETCKSNGLDFFPAVTKNSTWHLDQKKRLVHLLKPPKTNHSRISQSFLRFRCLDSLVRHWRHAVLHSAGLDDGDSGGSALGVDGGASLQRSYEGSGSQDDRQQCRLPVPWVGKKGWEKSMLWWIFGWGRWGEGCRWCFFWCKEFGVWRCLGEGFHFSMVFQRIIAFSCAMLLVSGQALPFGSFFSVDLPW